MSDGLGTNAALKDEHIRMRAHTRDLGVFGPAARAEAVREALEVAGFTLPLTKMTCSLPAGAWERLNELAGHPPVERAMEKKEGKPNEVA